MTGECNNKYSHETKLTRAVFCTFAAVMMATKSLGSDLPVQELCTHETSDLTFQLCSTIFTSLPG